MASRRQRRVQPYDNALPENWTNAKLISELNKLRVIVPANTRRTRLISLYKEHVGVQRDVSGTAQPTVSGTANSTAARLVTGTAVSQPEIDNQNNNIAENNERNELMAAVRELSATVNSMKQDMNVMSNEIKVLKNPRSIPAAAGSQEQLFTNSTSLSVSVDNDNNRGMSRTSRNDTESMSATDNTDGEITLQSAYRNMHGNLNPAMGLQNPNQFIKTKFGYAEESLPFVETVSPQVRRNIIEGKDVNLNILLMPYYSVDKKEKANDRPDPRLNKQLSITEFITAFGIYKNIMCDAFPHRRIELDFYERDIIEMSTRYQGNGFYEYHKLFSARAAAHLKYQGLPVDWSVRNNTLFCNIFANMTPISCYICKSINHSVNFCPLNTRNLNNGVSGRLSYVSPRDNKHEGKSDAYGRPRHTYGGLEICNNYNTEKGCIRQRCNNLHICISCKKSDHGKAQCNVPKNLAAPKALHKA